MQSNNKVNGKDAGAGAIFVAFGVLYGGLALFDLPIGRPANMGPGFFPLALSCILIVLGIAITLRGAFATKNRVPFGAVAWRGILFLSLSTIVFAAFIEELGLLPGLFCVTFLATLASRKFSPLKVVLTSLGVAAFCTAVFGYGLKLPLPVIGDWLRW